MNDESALNIFPSKKIKPYDGMSITADIWDEAHDEHRKARSAHDLYFHGAGIVTGLEVVANDPPDQYVFISPGVAVDPAGNVIVLEEQVAYDFGASVEGVLYLMLGHGEREIGGVQKETRYRQDEFVVAARPSLPKRPAVELARVNLPEKGSAIKNAADPAHPGINELDMRYRQEIGPRIPRTVHVGLVSAGKAADESVAGWDYLAKEAVRENAYHLVVDAAGTGDLADFDLLYVGGSGAFKLADLPAKEIAAYVKLGKPMIVEALDGAADDACQALLKELGLSVKAVGQNDALLKTPYLFTAPPPGGSVGKVSAGKGVIYSSAAYNLAWSGHINGQPAVHADIRAAWSWGLNLLTWLLG